MDSLPIDSKIGMITFSRLHAQIYGKQKCIYTHLWIGKTFSIFIIYFQMFMIIFQYSQLFLVLKNHEYQKIIYEYRKMNYIYIDVRNLRLFSNIHYFSLLISHFNNQYSFSFQYPFFNMHNYIELWILENELWILKNELYWENELWILKNEYEYQ